MDKLAPYQRITRIFIELDEFEKTSAKKIKRFLYKGKLDIADSKL
jgi:long-chain acyl-CoA synthetase